MATSHLQPMSSRARLSPCTMATSGRGASMGSAVAHTGPLRTGSRRTEGRLPLIACGTAGLSLEQAGARAWSELHLYDWFGKGCAQRSSQCRSPPPHMRISTHLHHFSVRLHELSSHDLRHCKSLSQWRHVSKFAQQIPKVNVHAGHLRKFPLFLYVFFFLRSVDLGCSRERV